MLFGHCLLHVSRDRVPCEPQHREVPRAAGSLKEHRDPRARTARHPTGRPYHENGQLLNDFAGRPRPLLELRNTARKEAPRFAHPWGPGERSSPPRSLGSAAPRLGIGQPPFGPSRLVPRKCTCDPPRSPRAQEGWERRAPFRNRARDLRKSLQNRSRARRRMPLIRPGRRGAALLLRSACGTLPHSRRLLDASRLTALFGSPRRLVRLLLPRTRARSTPWTCALRPRRRRLRPLLLRHRRPAGSLLLERRSRRLLATSPVSARSERPATARRPAPAATPSLRLLDRLWALSSGRWRCLLGFRFPRSGAVRFRPIRTRPRVSKLNPTDRAGGRS